MKNVKAKNSLLLLQLQLVQLRKRPMKISIGWHLQKQVGFLSSCEQVRVEGVVGGESGNLQRVSFFLHDYVLDFIVVIIVIVIIVVVVIVIVIVVVVVVVIIVIVQIVAIIWKNCIIVVVIVIV